VTMFTALRFLSKPTNRAAVFGSIHDLMWRTVPCSEGKACQICNQFAIT